MSSPISTFGASRTPSSDKRRPWPTFVAEAAVFLAIDALAIAATVRSAAAEPQPAVGPVWPFLASFAAVTALFLILLRRVKGARFFSALFSFAVLVGSASLGDAFFGIPGAVAVGSIAVLLWYGFPMIAVYDGVLILGLAGMVGVLGQGMSPVGAAVILAVLGLYDVVAVYGTKHMVEMAKALVQRKAFFAIIIPEAASGFRLSVRTVVPQDEYRFIGTGDAALPALLIASVARWEGILPAALVAGGSIIGLAAVNVLFSRQRTPAPMPALPPIALGALITYLLTTFI